LYFYNIAANLPQFCLAFAVCMERLLPLTMKMSIDGMENGTKQKKHLASLSLWKNCGNQLM
jgi:hypothetical protein